MFGYKLHKSSDKWALYVNLQSVQRRGSGHFGLLPSTCPTYLINMSAKADQSKWNTQGTPSYNIFAAINVKINDKNGRASCMHALILSMHDISSLPLLVFRVITSTCRYGGFNHTTLKHHLQPAAVLSPAHTRTPTHTPAPPPLMKT